MAEPTQRKRLSREESRAQTRERLIEAAYTVFTRDGLEAASIEDVAEFAGYSRGAFYSNFESKDDLVCALLEREIQKSSEAMEAILSTEMDPLDRMKAVREHYIHMGADRQGCLFWMAIQLYALQHPSVRPRIIELLRADRHAVVGYVQRMYADMEVAPPVEPEVISLGLIALAQGLSISQMVDPESISPDLLAHSLRTFFDRLTAPTP